MKNINEEHIKLNSEISNLKEKIVELNQIIIELRKENQILNNKKNYYNNQDYQNAEKFVKNSLYESLIIYIKNINLSHLMEVYQLNLQREEDIRKILESKKIPELTNINNQILKLSENFSSLKYNLENALREYHIRSKSYISYELYENKIIENKKFTENIMNMVLGKFFEKKDSKKDFILFRFEHNEYNQIIEDLTLELENFHKKELLVLENYKKNFSLIEPALELLQKQTILESDKLNVLLNNPNFKLI